MQCLTVEEFLCLEEKYKLKKEGKESFLIEHFGNTYYWSIVYNVLYDYTDHSVIYNKIIDFSYDPETDKWRSLKAMSTPRGLAGCALYKGKVIVVGTVHHCECVI